MISRAKDKLQNPVQMRAAEPGNFRAEVGARVYEEYQKLLKSANAVDFDDLIVLTVRLFEQNRPCWSGTRTATPTSWWTSTRTPTTPSTG